MLDLTSEHNSSGEVVLVCRWNLSEAHHRSPFTVNQALMAISIGSPSACNVIIPQSGCSGSGKGRVS